MTKADSVLVSVIIPTYSRNEDLERAIQCILQQTHQNLDIIIVDDNPQGSEYRISTEKMMKKYAKDSRIRYIQNEKNLGGSGARNVGIKAAKGEYVAFLDDDDVYYPTKIEKQLQVFLNATSDRLALVYCDVEHLGATGQVDCVVRAKHKGNCLYEAIVDDCIASTSLWLCKKSALEAVGNFTIVPCKQDSTVILKLLKAGYEVDYVSEILCQYYNVFGGVRISLGSKKIEGELLFCDACRECYDQFTKEQIRNIEYSFSKRMYVLYSHRQKDKMEEFLAERKKMRRIHPIASRMFEFRHKVHKWKLHRMYKK